MHRSDAAPYAPCVHPGEPDQPIEPLSSTLRHVQAAQAGDDSGTSWVNLEARIRDWVHAATMGTNLPPDRSLEDLQQDVLLQVFKDLDEFVVEPGASFSGWVRTVAHRKLGDLWRRARADKRGKGKARHLSEFDETGGPDHFADPKVERQSMILRHKELQERLVAALDQLGDKHRRVIELRLFQGRPFVEVAAELGYDKEVTVRSIYLRAVRRLQVLLEDFA